MENVVNRIHKYLEEVCNDINNINDEKELFYLYSRELSGLNEIIKLNDLSIDVPYELEKFRKFGYDFSNDLYFSYYEGFMDIYNSVKNINDKIALVGGSLFKEKELISKVNPELDLSVSDSLKIVHSFFEYYDGNMDKHFKKLCDDNNLFVVPLFSGSTIDGFTLTLNSQRQNFIEVNFRNDILLSSNIIHEVFHSYIESHMFDISYDERKKKFWNNLDEVITYFSSLVFILFLEDSNFDKKSIELLKYDSAIRMIFYTAEYSKYFDFSYRDIIFNEFEDYLLSDSVSYGTLMAYHYFDKYLYDEEGTKDNILNMSLDTSCKDKINLLNNYGLSSDNLGDENIPRKILRMQGYGFKEKK